MVERATTDSPGATFEWVSAVSPAGPHTFRAEVSELWTIGGKPNGGYLTALLARAARAELGALEPVASSCHFLRSPDPGPVDIEVEVLHRGRSSTQVRATLTQAGRPCVAGLLTFAVLGDPVTASWVDGSPAGQAPPFEGCVRLRGPEVPLMLTQLDVRLDAGSLAALGGRPRGRGELSGWLALPAGEAFDPVSLLLAVDAPPPASFDVRRTGWVPTMQLSTHVRALPVAGPVQFLQQVHSVRDDRLDETCWVWDGAGRLVARATQLAGVRWDAPAPG